MTKEQYYTTCPPAPKGSQRSVNITKQMSDRYDYKDASLRPATQASGHACGVVLTCATSQKRDRVTSTLFAPYKWILATCSRRDIGGL